jgi:cytochrome c-type biogenesis protein
MIQMALALLAGMLTVAAPCILPMLPILLGASIAQTGPARPLFIVAGFIGAFAAFAVLFAHVPRVLGLSPEALRTLAVALLLAFGALMIWPRAGALFATRVSGVANHASGLAGRAGSGNAGAFVLGMTLGILWTPCAGPVLGSILTLLASAQDTGRAFVLLLCYATGAGIPMLAIAYGGQRMTSRMRRLARHFESLQRAFGVCVVLTALAMYAQYDVWLAV